MHTVVRTSCVFTVVALVPTQKATMVVLRVSQVEVSKRAGLLGFPPSGTFRYDGQSRGVSTLLIKGPFTLCLYAINLKTFK